MSDRDLFAEMRQELLSADRFCSRCGRKLEVVTELSRERDRATGERIVENWLQCPRYPRNGLAYLFSREHDSISVENPMIGRSYQ